MVILNLREIFKFAVHVFVGCVGSNDKLQIGTSGTKGNASINVLPKKVNSA